MLDSKIWLAQVSVMTGLALRAPRGHVRRTIMTVVEQIVAGSKEDSVEYLSACEILYGQILHARLFHKRDTIRHIGHPDTTVRLYLDGSDAARNMLDYDKKDWRDGVDWLRGLNDQQWNLAKYRELNKGCYAFTSNDALLCKQAIEHLQVMIERSKSRGFRKITTQGTP